MVELLLLLLSLLLLLPLLLSLLLLLLLLLSLVVVLLLLLLLVMVVVVIAFVRSSLIKALRRLSLQIILNSLRKPHDEQAFEIPFEYKYGFVSFGTLMQLERCGGAAAVCG
jgi:hypothetical protein